MKSLTQHINEKLVLTKKLNKHTPKTRDELIKLIKQLIEERGNEANLNDIDVSEITDMSHLFWFYKRFNGDISKWDVSNVTDMTGMFEESDFNGDISEWDVSKVADMWKMFKKSKFNGDLSNWNMENVEYTTIMFSKSNFTGENGDISKWKFKKLLSAYGMFDPEKLSENDDLLDKAIDAWNLPDDIIDAMY